MWTVLGLSLVVLAAAGVGAAAFPPDVRQALATAKNLYVATKRKDGSTSKASPIWFMAEDDALYFTTVPTSYKAKRIAKGSPVLVWVGSEQGPHFVGKGEILRDPALADKMAPAYDQKYWISWIGFFRPRADRIRDGKTVIVRVTPLPAGP
jgi:PPOX class probable F420-dependent enzyme